MGKKIPTLILIVSLFGPVLFFGQPNFKPAENSEILADKGLSCGNVTFFQPLSSDLKKYFNNKETLPLWLLPSENHHIIIGISDPVEDSLTARSQAKTRAALIAALTHDVQISLITDLFKKLYNADATKLRKAWHFFRIETQLPEITIIDSATTQYGELIISASPDYNHLQQKVVLDGFIEENRYNDKTDFTYRFAIANTDGKQFKYVLRRVNNKISVTSGWRNKELKIPEYKYHYELNSGENQKKKYVRTDDFEYGLWGAFFFATVKEIYFQSRKYADYYTSELSDEYKAELSTRLNREIGSLEFDVVLNGFEVENRRLVPHLSIQPH
jgi:hypothetical protein